MIVAIDKNDNKRADIKNMLIINGYFQNNS